MDDDILKAKGETRKFIDSLTDLTDDERKKAEMLADDIIKMMVERLQIIERMKRRELRAKIISAALAIATKYTMELEQGT